MMQNETDNIKFQVHVLMAYTFLKEYSKDIYNIIHIDNDLWNNKLDNLQLSLIKEIEWYDFPEELLITKYEISKCGQIRHKNTKQILQPFIADKKYLQVAIYIEDNPKHLSVHLLVAYTFISKVDLSFNRRVKHLDGNINNNCVGNLEIVKDIDEWFDFPESMKLKNYQISKLGNIKSLVSNEILIPAKRKYYQLGLIHDSKIKRSYRVHVLVAKVFIDNPENKKTVDHINHDTHDNKIENLRWFTQKEQNNNRRKIKTLAEYCIGKKIIQFDNNNNIINTFTSIIEAAKNIKINLTITTIKYYILRCLYGKNKSFNNYKWQFADKIKTNKIKHKKLTINNKEIIVTPNGYIYNLRGELYRGIIEDYKIIHINKKYLVHRLVALAYVYNPDPIKFNVVNHKDGNKLNNNADNLEWCDQKHNTLEYYRLKKENKPDDTVVEKTTMKRNKLVVEYEDVNIINTFKTITEAALFHGINRCTMTEYCKDENNLKFRFG
jgi:hypothetical protein